MTQPLSHNFISALEDRRDELYVAALAKAGTPFEAEQLLQRTARDLFDRFTKGTVADASTAMASAFGPAIGGGAMPADVWARLAAAVQVEAAGSADARALHPDSVLLRPDPLLAPRKSTPRRDKDEFDISSPSRLIVLAGLALLIGIVLTVWISMRPHVPPAPPLSAPRLPGATTRAITETAAPASPATTTAATSASPAGAP